MDGSNLDKPVQRLDVFYGMPVLLHRVTILVKVSAQTAIPLIYPAIPES